MLATFPTGHRCGLPGHTTADCIAWHMATTKVLIMEILEAQLQSI